MNIDREHRQSWRKCEPAPRYRKGGNGNPLPKTVNGKYQASAESPERRTLAEGNFVHMPAARTQCRGQSQDVLYRIRKAEKRDKNLRFNNLMHHISIDLLRECFYGLKRKASPRIDGKTWYEYRETLEQRLPKLHLEIQSNRYRPKPSLRTSISKENGEQRLLGIATLEDKVVQLATVKVLESIYEADFMGFSYGFRPVRSQHDALDALAVALKLHKVNWIIDADIRKFFDRMDHEILMRFISHRIADKRILRLIKKWLTAGVIVDGKIHFFNFRTTPQLICHQKSRNLVKFHLQNLQNRINIPYALILSILYYRNFPPCVQRALTYLECRLLYGVIIPFLSMATDRLKSIK